MSKTLEMNFASSQSTIISHPMKRRRNLSLNHEWPQHFFCAKGDRARERGSLFFFLYQRRRSKDGCTLPRSTNAPNPSNKQ